jgi:23S rRNA (cytosine1962-C5)-methyltransferase
VTAPGSSGSAPGPSIGRIRARSAHADPQAWDAADLRFERDRGWTGRAVALGPWPVEVEGLTLDLRTTDAGQVGLFPEHLAMIPWLRDQVEARTVRSTEGADSSPAVLHLFAYTGIATLAMAAVGANVTHVDSSRPTVTWARRNADASGLGDRPIRWIVDDAVAFAEREVRRGRRYAGLVLDPPTYGHGPSGRPWQLAEQLPALLDTCQALLEPDGFVLVTAHTPGIEGNHLAALLDGNRFRPARGVLSARGVDRGELSVETDDGRRLELGAFARWPAGAS